MFYYLNFTVKNKWSISDDSIMFLHCFFFLHNFLSKLYKGQLIFLSEFNVILDEMS